MEEDTIIRSILDLKISDLDLKLNSDELETILLKIHEKIRLLNLDYFETKKKMFESKRQLDFYEGQCVLSFTKEENKNDSTRKAVIMTNQHYMNLRREVEELQAELEMRDQVLWSYRHAESNFKCVAELRMQEMRTLSTMR